MDFLHRPNCVAAALVLGIMTAGGTVVAEDFYAGKNINFVIASAVGGGYDTYGRLVAAHIGQNLPGHPSVVPQNMPGAGGIRAANYLYSVAPKDGLTIGMIDQAVCLDKILGKEELTAEPAKFNWLGRIASNNAVLFASSSAPVKKIEDALTQELIVAAPGTSSKLRWTVLKNVIGLNAKVISAYKGTNDSRLAQQRGEIHALSMPWTVLRVQEAASLKDKSIVVLMQTGIEKAADLQDIPRMIDLAKNEDDRALVRLFSSPDTIGRSVLAPPGLSAERVSELRRAFLATTKDPDFLKDVQKLNLDLDPLSGDELQTIVASGDQLSPALVGRARALANAQ